MKRVLGNSYNYRLKIKSEGGVWVAKEKAWFVPDEKYDEIQKLVNGNSCTKSFESDKSNIIIHKQLRSWTC